MLCIPTGTACLLAPSFVRAAALHEACMARVWMPLSSAQPPHACRAPDLYARCLAPVLDAAGLQVAVVTTRARGHAAEVARGLRTDECDAVVCVGGDGTVYEALQVLPLLSTG